MLYRTPSEEVRPLSIEDGKKLFQDVQQVLRHIKKGELPLDQIAEVVYRLLATENNLAIYDKRFLRFSEKKSENFEITDFHKFEGRIAFEQSLRPDATPSLKNLFGKRREASETKDAFLDSFPNDIIGQAASHAIQAHYRLEEFQKTKDERFKKRAVENLKCLEEACKILASPKNALEAFRQRIASYQSQIIKLNNAAQDAVKKGKSEFVIPVAQRLIPVFEQKIKKLAPHLKAISSSRGANLDLNGKNAPQGTPSQTSLFEEK